MQLMGDGPWERDAFGTLLEAQGFCLWDLPDSDIAHVVVGRDNWDANRLVEQIDARYGLALRIYSQEMWFAMMATGRDPFDADDDDLLLAFGRGHAVLELLMGREPPWPVVSPPPSSRVALVDDDEIEGVDETPVHILGHRVGETSP